MKSDPYLNGYIQVMQNIRERALACGRPIEEITLIAVSKGCPVNAVRSVYQQGCRTFGESRIQAALEKIPELPKDCSWHLIGSLQTNKVGKAISTFQLIHSVDSLQLAQKISQVSQDKGITTSILLQVNTSGEGTKHGLSSQQWERTLDEINLLSNIKIEGLMTIARLTEDREVIRTCFRQLYQLREAWRPQMKEPRLFQQLSMGMSHDYLIAIEEGATLLRIGAAIFQRLIE